MTAEASLQLGFVIGAPWRSAKGSAQINDVRVDENRIVYTVDRFTGGLYTLERLSRRQMPFSG